ncbi:MAG: diacylglycerol/polyprenol kinase family protein [Candidatus Heimdallarchaeaceae archaeon]
MLIFVILGITLLLKKLNQPPWRVRKIGHILIHFALAFIPYFFVNLFDLLITIVVLLTGVIILTLIPSVRLLVKVIEYCTRNGERNIELIINSTLTAATVFGLYFLFQNNLFIYTASLLTLSLGDGLGEIIGRPYGKIKYRIFLDKSAEGSFAVFVGSCIGILLSFAVNNILVTANIWKIFVGAIIVVVVEACNYWFIDNISVPIITALFLYLTQ